MLSRLIETLSRPSTPHEPRKHGSRWRLAKHAFATRRPRYDRSPPGIAREISTYTQSGFVMTIPSLFANADQEQKFNEQRRKEAFLDACRHPSRWLDSARRHMRAANILYNIACIGYKKSRERFLAEVDGMKPGDITSRILCAQELIDNADADLLQDYLLLAGYALECVFKASLLAMLPELVKNDKRLDKLITTHDLCTLAFDCGISLTAEERDLLRLIERHISWGKYGAPIELNSMPCPTDPEDFRKKSLMMVNACHGRKEQRIVDDLLRRGIDVLHAHLPS